MRIRGQGYCWMGFSLYRLGSDLFEEGWREILTLRQNDGIFGVDVLD